MMLLTIIICAALAIVLFSADVSWSNVLSQKRNDLVFESRNKEYGAYLQCKHQLNPMATYSLRAAVQMATPQSTFLSSLHTKAR